MNLPHVAIAPENGALVFTHVKAEIADYLAVDLPLKSLNDSGFDAAAKNIGSIVLGLIGLWYKNEMAAFPELAVPYDSQSDLDLIASLISKSVRAKTNMHIPSIDAIIAQVLHDDPKAAEHWAIATWPDVRNRLERHSV